MMEKELAMNMEKSVFFLSRIAFFAQPKHEVCQCANALAGLAVHAGFVPTKMAAFFHHTIFFGDFRKVAPTKTEDG